MAGREWHSCRRRWNPPDSAAPRSASRSLLRASSPWHWSWWAPDGRPSLQPGMPRPWVFVDEPAAGFAEEREVPEVRLDSGDAFDDPFAPDLAGDLEEDFDAPEEGSAPKPSICFQEEPPSFMP